MALPSTIPLELIRGLQVASAGYYKRRDVEDRFVVYLNWKGQRFKRYHYDARFPLLHEDLAKDLVTAINQDIRERGDGFDPERWFRSRSSIKRFPEYLADWLSRQHLGHSYAPTVKRAVKHARAWDGWRDLTIQQIRGGHLQDWVDQLPGHLSPKSKKNLLAVLHKVFREARDKREEIDRIPVWPEIHVPEYEPEHLSREWQDKILQEIPAQDRPLFAFMMLYGCRPGEARGLKWDCVDRAHETVIFRRTFSWSTLKEKTKSGRIRTLPWMPGTAEVLEEAEAHPKTARGLDGQPAGFVFLNRFGRHYTDEISRTWNEARDRAGCPKKIKLYEAIRHSWGTQAVEDGIPLEIIRDWLGHTGNAMTRRYARVTGKALEAATRRTSGAPLKENPPRKPPKS